ncbi:MAG: DegT/DnrJ/EryC1/StrS family aminotransferase [Pseudomonadota bacterium]
MAIKLDFLKHVVTAFVFVAIFASPVTAQQSEEDLLQQLREAPESEAARLDRELALIWDNSGSAAMNLLLRRGRDAIKEEEVGKAIDHLTALTDHAPQFAEGWHARATAFYQAGLYGPALGHHPGDFPNAERLSQEILSLPMYPGLTRAQIDRVVGAIASAVGIRSADCELVSEPQR